MDEQKNTTEVNTDEILEYPDFSKLNRVNFRKLPKDTIFGILKSHFLIYAVAFLVSLAFIAPYAFCSQDKWQSISMSIGASGVGAVLLGYFIELAAK